MRINKVLYDVVTMLRLLLWFWFQIDYLLFNVTFNDVSVIYVTAHTCIEKEVWPTVGLPRHRHFAGFFNVPVQAHTRATLFTVIPRSCPISIAFYDAHGDTEDVLHSRVPTRALCSNKIIYNKNTAIANLVRYFEMRTTGFRVKTSSRAARLWTKTLVVQLVYWPKTLNCATGLRAKMLSRAIHNA